MLKGEKRILAIQNDIGKQVVGRTWINILDKSRGKEINKKEFNRIVNQNIRFGKGTSEQILDILKMNGKIKVTQRRIKLL